MAAGLGAAALILVWQAAAGAVAPGAWLYVAPVLEEVAKTGFAVALAAPLLMAHTVFGAVEAVYDLALAGRSGVLPALAGILAHLAFGAITAEVAGLTGRLDGGVAAAAAVHLAWNAMIGTLRRPRRTPALRRGSR